MTSSTDRKVKIFDVRDGTKLGTLKQGFMQKGSNYKWNFPLDKYLAKSDERVLKVQDVLDDMRDKMDSKMSTKRYNQIKKMETET